MPKKEPKSKLRKKLYIQLAQNFKKMAELLEEYANVEDVSEPSERKRSNAPVWSKTQLEKFEKLIKEHGADPDKISKHFEAPFAEIKKRVAVYVAAGKAGTPKKQKPVEDHVSDSAEEASEEEGSE